MTVSTIIGAVMKPSVAITPPAAPLRLVADEGGDVDRYYARRTLPHRVVVRQLRLRNPAARLDEFPPQQREHREAAAEGDAAQLQENQVKFDKLFHFMTPP